MMMRFYPDHIFVSDYGMADTSHPTWLFVDDIVGPSQEGATSIDGK
jgi:hypothetical protein